MKKIISKIKSLFFRGAQRTLSFFNSSWSNYGQGWNKTSYLESFEKSLYVHVCSNKRGQKVGTIEFKLYEIKNSKGDVVEVKNHPVLDLLYRPNPFQTKEEFFQLYQIYKDLSGNAFIYLLRNDGGIVSEMYLLRPDRITIYPGKDEFISHYVFRKDDGTEMRIENEDMVHIKDPSPIDQYLGVAVLKPAAKRVDIEEYANTYQRDFFKNNARPDALIKVDYQLLPEQREEMKEAWEDRHRGVGASSKLGILEAGQSFQQVSLSQRDMDYIESMKFTRDDILIAFQVPKVIVSVVDDVNRANAETSMVIFLSETIQPEMAKLVGKLNEELVIPSFGENLMLDFIDPTPENREAILSEYKTGIEKNYLLINEVREKEGLEPVEGGYNFYMPVSATPKGGLPKAKQPKKGIEILRRPKSFFLSRILEDEKGGEEIFKGRQFLKLKFEIGEAIANKLKENVKKIERKNKEAKSKGKTKKNKKEFIKIINDEIREDYAKMILKVIDNQVDEFKKAMVKFGKGQEARVQSALKEVAKGKTKSLKKKIDVSVSDIFDKKKENKLLAKIGGPLIKEFLKLAGEEALNTLTPADDYEQSEEATKFVKERTKYFAKSVNDTTVDKLKKAITEGVRAGEGVLKISKRVSEIYKEMPDYRAEMIARTEVTNANNEGLIDGYRQSGVATHKEWIATLDSRTREEHLSLNGEIVAINKNFSNNLPYPQEVNCRCVIAPVIEN